MELVIFLFACVNPGVSHLAVLDNPVQSCFGSEFRSSFCKRERKEGKTEWRRGWWGVEKERNGEMKEEAKEGRREEGKKEEENFQRKFLIEFHLPLSRCTFLISKHQNVHLKYLQCLLVNHTL